MNIFVTGTDTDVGKTVVTAGMAAVLQAFGYSTAVYKPVQTGAIFTDTGCYSPDLEYIKSIDPNITVKSTYSFSYPGAPDLSARLENVIINKNNFLKDYQELNNNFDFVITEGAGGLLVPVYEDMLMRDLAMLLNLPLLIIARPGLGTINHTLLTIEAAKKSKLNILGVIISNYPTDTSDHAIINAPSMIEKISGIKVIGILPHIEQLYSAPDSTEQLIDAVINSIDIQKIFTINIPKLAQSHI